MKTFTMWIRGREYEIDGFVDGPDPDVGIYGPEFVVGSLRDVVTSEAVFWYGNGTVFLSRAEQAAVSEAYFDTFEPHYYEFEWLWQTEMGARAQDADAELEAAFEESYETVY